MPYNLSTTDPAFENDFAAVLNSKREDQADVTAAVADIIADVIRRGDDAVLGLTEKFDHIKAVSMQDLMLTADDLSAAYDRIDDNLRAALHLAADRITAFQKNYKAPVWVAMEYRYMPPLQEFIHQVESVTGDLKMLTITEHRFPFLKKVGDWNRFNANSGGTFVEKCCHFFDLMRHIIGANPIRIMASAGQEVNHLDEVYDGKTSDIWDCGFVIVDFANGKRAMLELSMFAEGSEFQEMIHAVGPDGKLEVKLPGPARFWSGEKAQPVPQLITSKRESCNPITQQMPIDETILAAGDHNGSTYHQHVKFLAVVKGEAEVEVSLDDGIWAVKMGHAAQESARTGQAISLES